MFRMLEKLVPLVFTVIVGTVVVYGLTAARVGRWLGVATPNAQGCLIIGAHPLARAIGLAIQQSNHTVLLVDTNREDIAQARLAGLPTYNGSIVGPKAEEKIELSGLGRMLAITSNNEVNALACVRFAKTFGRSEVYQLAPNHSPQLPQSAYRLRRELSEELRGRQLFNASCSLGDLQSRFADGRDRGRQLPSQTCLRLRSFRAANANAIPMFLAGIDGELTMITEGLPNDSFSGRTLISLSAPRE